MHRKATQYYFDSSQYVSPQNSNSIILIDSSVYKTKDSGGNINILGEVQNAGSRDLSFVKITYTFKDASDLLIDTDYTYIYGSTKKLTSSGIDTDTILVPNESGAFELFTDVPYDQVASMYYSISYETYETSPMGATIVKYGEITKQQDSSGKLKVLGEIQNTGTATIGIFAKFRTIPKNVEGQVLDMDTGCVNGDTVELTSGISTDTALKPGSIGSFDIYTDAPYEETSTLDYKINWDEGGVVGPPTLITKQPSSVPYDSASSGGNVTHDGGFSVTARGVCWNISGNPTIKDRNTIDGNGTGNFTSLITELSPVTTYHVRAYATNSAGTAYGNDVLPTTPYSSTSYVISDGQCGQDPCYSTIQQALEAAGAGALVKVADGIYPEAPDWKKAGIVTISGGWKNSFTEHNRITEIYNPLVTGGGSVKLQPNVKVIPQ